ncbi:MAG: GNAT family N-acetyltransferase [Ruminococcus sp.]|nr:GNAT family N-acetyltransferase [Ruminococcus sp.]
MDKIEITFNDITPDEWLQMRKAVGFPLFDREIAQKALNGSLGVLGIKKDGTHIGMLRILGDGAYSFYFNDVIIVPAFHRMGLGKKLINKAVEFIRNNFCTETMFSISIFANAMSEEFYEKVGFSVRKEIPMKVFVRDIHVGSRQECLNKN